MQQLAERARKRLREEFERKDLSQQEIADLLKWSQSRVAQKLTGSTPITLSELESLCFAAGLAITEVVRDHGYEFCAEMTPSELHMLQQMREIEPEELLWIEHTLDMMIALPLEKRRAMGLFTKKIAKRK